MPRNASEGWSDDTRTPEPPKMPNEGRNRMKPIRTYEKKRKVIPVPKIQGPLKPTEKD